MSEAQATSKQAIEGKRGTHFQVDPFTLAVPDVDYVSGPDDPYYNPRINKQYRDANGALAYDEALIDSIMRLGVIEPIITAKRDGDIVVVAGCRRVLHAREANKRLAAAGKEEILVPCMSPLRGFDDAEIGELSIAENELRSENSPLVKAELAALQLRRRGGNVSEAAKAFGMGEQTFRQLLSLREADPEVKAAVTTGAISTSAGVELARLPRAQQVKALTKTKARGGTSEAAREARHEVAGTQTRPSVATLRKLWSELTPDERKSGSGEFLAWILGEGSMPKDVATKLRA